MNRLSRTGKPAQQLMSLLWAEDNGLSAGGRIFASTRRLLELDLVWRGRDTVSVHLTNEGRRVARELMATPEGQAYIAWGEQEDKDGKPYPGFKAVAAQ